MKALSLVIFFIALAFTFVYGQTKTEKLYTESFNQENCHFVNINMGMNPYFYLRPNYQLTLVGVKDKDTTQLVITVLNDTKTIGNINTRVVEERESVNGKVVEVSRNYVAMCKETGSIFYFGEDVDIYKGDTVATHSGTWIGEGSNRPGILMPGLPLLGARYYQEIAPGIAMDRAEVISMTDSMTTAAGTFKNVLKILETTPLEPGDKSFKFYALYVGLVKDGNLTLVKYGQAGAK